jgi:hypothetical protein
MTTVRVARHTTGHKNVRSEACEASLLLQRRFPTLRMSLDLINDRQGGNHGAQYHYALDPQRHSSACGNS